ncbi:ATP-binding protein [Thalassotalea sp. 1_MG-2023]|uniref:ATP-binding protein n=1 Tax=Thalassotalea sp. 1_MG-2023 TaxID=3062680 RepID=UPI0026E1D975|nr:ATP-binding protein [Thalassotalea sp. 1_MG-2023]MDO6428625.1 ATP-binding protein [Thalassotalea sp. 1_MG-2023]
MRYLLISLVSVTILATVSLGWLFDNVYEQYQQEQQPLTSIEMAEELGLAFAIAIDKTSNSDEFLSNWPNKSQYIISLHTITEAELPQALIHQLKQGEVVILETQNTQMFHYYLSSKEQILVLESPRLTQVKQYTYQQYMLTLSFYLLLILLFLIWAYPLLKQLSSLRNAAKSFGNGKLDEQIATNSISYIRDIELDFNTMARRINSLVGDVKLLSTAVSHDLRTPLARIRFGLDTLEEVEDDEHRNKLQQKLGKDVDEMTLLVETLLNFARLDQQTMTLKKVSVDLVQLINECIENKQSDIVEIDFNCSARKTSTTADRNYLKMVFNNVIQNAINYGRAKVIIALESDKNSFIVRVSDDGKGIPVDIRDQIVKPFIRGAKSESNYKGHGVGLAIVKRVLDWHNATLIIGDSNELSGAEFQILLPKNNQSDIK